MYQRRLWSCAALLAAAACTDTNSAGAPEASPSPTTVATSPAQLARSSIATLGPIIFRYDPARLSLAEVTLKIPPDYNAESWGLKLVPASRAAHFGREDCSYGQSGTLQTCTPELEAGLALALLERPLADYRREFDESELASELRPSRLDGEIGFELTVSAEGSGTTYRFLPVEERTLLIAHHFSPDGQELPAMAEVLSSIARDLEDDA